MGQQSDLEARIYAQVRCFRTISKKMALKWRWKCRICRQVRCFRKAPPSVQVISKQLRSSDLSAGAVFSSACEIVSKWICAQARCFRANVRLICRQARCFRMLFRGRVGEMGVERSCKCWICRQVRCFCMAPPSVQVMSKQTRSSDLSAGAVFSRACQIV